MSELKNVIVVNDFDYIQGGASKVAIDTANMLIEHNSNLKVYFFSGDTKNDDSLNSKVIRVCTNQGEALKDKNKIRGMINGLYNFKAKKELKKLLKTLNPSETIIHVHGWTKCLSSSVFNIAFKMKFKVVLTMHDYFTACPNGGYFNYKKNEICHIKPLSLKCIKCNCDSRNYAFKIYRIVRQFIQNKTVRLNDKLTDVISISDFSEKILKQTLASSTNIHRVYNPIDLDPNRENMDYKNNKYYLFVGRVSKEKGVDIFCQAISDLDLKGIVVGDGDEREFLQKKYPTIEFVGWKNSEEVKKYMKKAKALIFPSKWYEGAPLTPLESMQYGIPCFSSDCNAASDYIKEYINGFTFSNVDELKKKIIKSNNIDFKVNIYEFASRSYIDDLIGCYEKIRKG